ncbi:DUF2164 domain-containing protein [Patescibacteria group bacterium]|nr:DUF2164 domain-containing protein [Patescibacteria group bacterium]
MKKVKRQWDMITEEKRKFCIDEIQRFFLNSRDEEIGVIAAEEVLDAVLEMVSIDIYKRGLADAKKVVEEFTDDLKVDLDMLTN